MEDIVDGSSNTLLAAEKRVYPDFARIASSGDYWCDNVGYIFGFNCNFIRSTSTKPNTLSQQEHDLDWAAPTQKSAGPPTADRDAPPGLQEQSWDYFFGSSHPGFINAVFVDGSIHTISFNISAAVFDSLGNIRDGGNVNDPAVQ
jgi:hypothetical protein